MIPTASVVQGHEIYVAIFLKRLRSGDGVKTSEKANMHNQHWLTSTRSVQRTLDKISY